VREVAEVALDLDSLRPRELEPKAGDGESSTESPSKGFSTGFPRRVGGEWARETSRVGNRISWLESQPEYVRHDMVVKKSDIGRLIGVRGVVLHRLLTRTQCEIFVLDKEGHPPDISDLERLVILIGTLEQVKFAMAETTSVLTAIPPMARTETASTAVGHHPERRRRSAEGERHAAQTPGGMSGGRNKEQFEGQQAYADHHAYGDLNAYGAQQGHGGQAGGWLIGSAAAETGYPHMVTYHELPLQPMMAMPSAPYLPPHMQTGLPVAQQPPPGLVMHPQQYPQQSPQQQPAPTGLYSTMVAYPSAPPPYAVQGATPQYRPSVPYQQPVPYAAPQPWLLQPSLLQPPYPPAPPFAPPYAPAAYQQTAYYAGQPPAGAMAQQYAPSQAATGYPAVQSYGY